MQIRRRTPSIFNLSMVDILCCALGCVILLWVVYSREARRRSEQAEGIAKELEAAKSHLADVESQKSKLETQVQSVRDRLRVVLVTLEKKQKAYEALDQLLRAERQKLTRLDEAKRGLETDLAALQAKYKDALVSLDKKRKAHDALVKSMAATKKQLDALRLTLAKKDQAISIAAKTEKDLRKQLDGLNNSVAALRKQLDSVTTARDDLSGKLKLSEKELQTLAARLKDAKKTNQGLTAKLAASDEAVKELTAKLEATEKLARQIRDVALAWKDRAELMTKKWQQSSKAHADLEKKLEAQQTDLAKAAAELAQLAKERLALQQRLVKHESTLKTTNLTLQSLQSDNRKLRKERDQLRAAISDRFAGINLTGRKVLFIVDMSGSMSMFDTKTPAPGKWEEVCETIGKVLRSLPNVTHFQVIAFSEKVIYPLGSPGRWFAYDPSSSPDRVVAALKKITPEGGTQMRPAFAEAFDKFRRQGLDTIYLVSDGLPNADPDLPAEAAKLEGVQLTSYLSDLIRRQLREEWNRPVQGRVPVTIHAIGYFFESPEVGAFLWALARENGGSFVGMSRP